MVLTSNKTDFKEDNLYTMFEITDSVISSISQHSAPILIGVQSTPHNTSLPYFDEDELNSVKFDSITQINNYRDWIDEDYDHPTEFIIRMAEYILSNIELKYYKNFKDVFVNPYGTVEIIFESKDKRIFSLEIGADGLNYFIQLKGQATITKEFSTSEIIGSIYHINFDLINLY